ncbi:putative 2-dehydro-3-deoxygalactonokinase DgoK1 [Rhodovastum atsumiense]|uniref:2-dehydro-3-deoxygalactonokinase n=1 Tax=Rhodovastum atsumiense TaxID=504468 RepID=A0A5M6IQ52_9PROT|nr:2-dehydro-3-deoxygalactonokinase [Rhodovastum atsumiense]KAA5610400.1 2-dehydro-3-deoxygalactonokinase [Rhodovastum atsumiense]CAH2602918.1 putative 2-dehydro-3-deoxygalactonokinase DgoK1 [Rhodovastum atsumiense]
MTNLVAPSLVALDWGTSSLRAYLLGPDGAVLDRRAGPWGIMQVQAGDFAGAFATVTAAWQARWPELPALASGMIGSAQGWVEAPYLECPAGAGELAHALVAVPGTRLLLVPGVAQWGATPNVMRGEETQIAGALALRAELHASCRIVLPGTHSKWVTVTDGRIRHFTTYMTGELFAVLRGHSILGRLAAGEGAPEAEAAAAAFARGLLAARDAPGGIAPLLFSARALVLAGALRAAESLDYLSGLLIGDELRTALAAPPETAGPLALVGDAALCDRYARAIALFGGPDPIVLGDTATSGLWRIARDAGLVAPSASCQE